MPNHWISYFIRLPLLLRLLFLASITIIFFGIFVHFIEPLEFPTVFDGIWWAIVTASTIGYGDFIPQTTLGRLSTIILIMVGASFLASYFANLATTVVLKQNDIVKGKTNFKGRNHLIIVGWNERAKSLIQFIQQSNRKEQIILIDETLDKNPYDSGYVHFIKGRSHLDEVLLRANIAYAKTIFITADQSKTESQSDMFTILTLLSVKGLNKNAYCSAEILTTSQIENAKRAGANHIIQSNELLSYYMINSFLHQEDNHSNLDLLKIFCSSNISFVEMDSKFINHTFEEVLFSLLKRNELLIGIQCSNKILLKPSLKTIMVEDTKLIVILNNPIT